MIAIIKFKVYVYKNENTLKCHQRKERKNPLIQDKDEINTFYYW